MKELEASRELHSSHRPNTIELASEKKKMLIFRTPIDRLFERVLLDSDRRQKSPAFAHV